MPNLESISAPATTIANEEVSGAIQQQMSDAEDLTNELKRLLVKYEPALQEEGIRKQVETLERWMEAYRHGLSAARKISENGTSWLTELRNRLKLAADELQRIESEGGNPATGEQASQAEEFLKASRRIDKVIPNIEHMFGLEKPVDTPSVECAEHA
jgi:hypothetical protein